MTTTLEQLRLDGCKVIECFCEHCCVVVDLRIDRLPIWSRALTMDELKKRLTCKRCGRKTGGARAYDGRAQGVPREMW